MFRDVVRLLTSTTRAKLLKFFLFQTDGRANLATTVATLGLKKSPVEKELLQLARMGILIKKQTKDKIFLVNYAHPLVEPLRIFLEATTLPTDREIKDAFRGVRGLSLLIASGALARESRSSIDLLIVVAKNPHDPHIIQAVKRAERLSALPLRYAVFAAKDYEERIQAYDRLLRDVFEFSHRIIIRET